MDTAASVKVTAADRTNDGIIITFSDGNCGVYSSELLYSVLGLARKLHESSHVESAETEAPTLSHLG